MSNNANSKWICEICGWEYEGPSPPDVCPVCGAGPDDFSMAETEESPEKSGEPVRWICKVCDYVHEGVEPPEVCPVCGVGPEEFEKEASRDEIKTAEEMTPEKTLSDVMAETLVQCGIRHVFGMVGHSNLGMAEALRKQDEKGGLQFIDIRHEGAAAFACSSYAKLTGKPAVCFTIAGPGATNLLTGLYDAKVDRVPILAITGQVDTQVLGPGAFQEINLTNVFQDVSCFNHTVLSSSNPAELVVLAIKNALLHRDVANLILPNEIQNLPAGRHNKAGGVEGRIPSLDISPSRETCQK
ncbi:MAG: thiamine pyrophosphate-binding protein, partial [Candidatus Hinthialibacter sp.]